MGLTLEDYFDRIKEWELIYGKPPPVIRNTDLTAVKIACLRCGSIRKRMSRHHKGNDFFFAQMMPNIYAKRYIQFHPNDVARLCDTCHKRIHTYYKPLMERLQKELNKNGTRIITKEWCDGWMNRFREAFQQWLASPYRKKRRKRR